MRRACSALPRCRPVAVAVTSLALLGSGGCGRVLGTDEYGTRAPPGSGGTATGSPSDAAADAAIEYTSTVFDVGFSSVKCGQCSDETCANEETACQANADCLAWARCRARCTNAECIAQCPRRVPRVTEIVGLTYYPVPTAGDYGACLHRNCQVPCLAEFAGVDRPMSPDCYDCTARMCSDVLSASIDGGALAPCAPCDAKCAEPDWSCLGNVEWPEPPVVQPPIDYSVTAFDLFHANVKIANGDVTLCAALGSECDAMGPTARTRLDGTASLRVTQAQQFSRTLFTFWELQSDVYLPTINWMTPPPVATGSDNRGMTSLADLASFANLDMDLATKGLIGIVQIACNNMPAEGVVLRIDDPSGGSPTISYSNGGQVDFGNTSTSSSGGIQALNVAPSPSVRLVTSLADGRVVSDVSVIVRAGWATFLTLTPTPRR